MQTPFSHPWPFIRGVEKSADVHTYQFRKNSRNATIEADSSVTDINFVLFISVSTNLEVNNTNFGSIRKELLHDDLDLWFGGLLSSWCSTLWHKKFAYSARFLDVLYSKKCIRDSEKLPI